MLSMSWNVKTEKKKFTRKTRGNFWKIRKELVPRLFSEMQKKKKMNIPSRFIKSVQVRGVNESQIMPRRQSQIYVDMVYDEWRLPCCKILTEKQAKVRSDAMVDRFSNWTTLVICEQRMAMHEGTRNKGMHVEWSLIQAVSDAYSGHLFLLIT